MTAPWAQQLPELTLKQIRKACEQIPAPRHDLARLDPHAAEKALDDMLSGTFVVTESIGQTLHSLYHSARANLHSRYTSEKDFHSAIMSREFPDATLPAVCFTGLAGVGKSMILKALGRLLRYPVPMFQLVNSVEIELKAYLHIPVKTAKTSTAIFEKVYSQLTSDGRKAIRLKGKAGSVTQAEAFRCGLILVGLDELQHMTLSAYSNARVTGALLSMLEEGMPIVFGCNYSLVRRLLRRNQEDKDRLLRAMIEQRPEQAESADWMRLVHVMVGNAPDAFRLSGEAHAELLAELSACGPRMLRYLLLFAYRRARASGRSCAIDSDVMRAYRSIEFSSMRITVEALKQQSLTGEIKRQDLALPPELADQVEQKESIQREREREQNKVRTKSALAGSLTVLEKKGLKIAAASAQEQSDNRIQAVPKRSQQRRVSVESLREGMDFLKRRH